MGSVEKSVEPLNPRLQAAFHVGHAARERPEHGSYFQGQHFAALRFPEALLCRLVEEQLVPGSDEIELHSGKILKEHGAGSGSARVDGFERGQQVGSAKVRPGYATENRLGARVIIVGKQPFGGGVDTRGWYCHDRKIVRIELL